MEILAFLSNLFRSRCLTLSLPWHSFVTKGRKALFTSRSRVQRKSVLQPAIRASSSYNQLQKYLRHCTVFWHKWPVHDLVLLIPPPPLIKVASNTRPYSKLRGTTLNGREEGGQYYMLQTCDQERFEARKVLFPWECLIIFATGCSMY